MIPIYSEVFDKYVKEFHSTSINYANTKAKSRGFVMASVSVIIIIALYIIGLKYGIEWISIIGVIILTVSAVIILIVLNDRDKEILIKKYHHLEFSPDQKSNIKQIIRRIQLLYLKNFLQEGVERLDYIRHLMNTANEKSKEDKIGFSNPSAGVFAIILIVLSNFFTLLYNMWQPILNTTTTLTYATLGLLLVLSYVFFMYIFAKDQILNTLNADLRHHRDLYYLLQDIETEIRF